MKSTMPPAQPDTVAQTLIAVVDDDVSFLRSVGRLLLSAGYQVQTFSSAREFLAALPSFAPHCLVVDVHMPDMTGLELLDWLRAQGSDLPTILVTAYDTPKTRDHAQRAGTFGLLLKPFDKLALMDAIDCAVGRPPLALDPGLAQRPTLKPGE
jgi:FixJ family two-component response regulator